MSWWETLVGQAAQATGTSRESVDSDGVLDVLEYHKIISGKQRNKRELLKVLSRDETKRAMANATNRTKHSEQFLSMLKKLGDIDASNWRRKHQGAVELLKENAKLYNASLKALETPDCKFKSRLNTLGGQAATTGTDLAQAYTRLYAQPVTGEDPVNDPTRPDFPASFRLYADRMNALVGAGAKYFEFDAEDNVIDVDWGALAESGIRGQQADNLKGDIEAYNAKQKVIKAAIQSGTDGYAAAQDTLAKIGTGEIDWSTGIEQVKNLIGSIPGVLDEHVMTVQDASEELSANQQIQDEVDDLSADINRLRGTREGSEQMDGFARAVADPAFRAWAVDHGFDNLSVIPMREDGTPDISRYSPGGDDLAAKAAYEREYERGPNSYGFKRITTGEIVQVTLASGQRVFGDRLKYHAADEPGTVRVVTEDGSLQIIPPSDLKQVVVVERDEKKMGKLERRAARIARRRGEKYGAAAAAAMSGDPEQMIGSATTETGDYVIDSQGNYIKQDDYNNQVDDYIEGQTVTYYGREGEHFIETQPDGKMYQVSSVDGSITLLDEANDDDVKKIALARSEKPRRTTITRDGKLVPLIRGEFEEMIKAGKMDESLGAEAFPGEPHYEQGTFERLDAAYSDLRKSVTPEDVGFSATQEKPDPFRDQPLSQRRLIGGVEYADLAGQEEDPIEDDYVGPTPEEDQLSEDETRRQMMFEAAVGRITDVETKDEGEEELFAQSLRDLFDESAKAPPKPKEKVEVPEGTGEKIGEELEPVTDATAKEQTKEATEASQEAVTQANVDSAMEAWERGEPETERKAKKAGREARRSALRGLFGGKPKERYSDIDSALMDVTDLKDKDIGLPFQSDRVLSDALRKRRDEVSQESGTPQTSPIAPGKSGAVPPLAKTSVGPSKSEEEEFESALDRAKKAGGRLIETETHVGSP